MAIQKINLGTEPLGEGGDTYRSANTKINENFSNTAHAASKLVGTGAGQVPLSEDVVHAFFDTNAPLRATPSEVPAAAMGVSGEVDVSKILRGAYYIGSSITEKRVSVPTDYAENQNMLLYALPSVTPQSTLQLSYTFNGQTSLYIRGIHNNSVRSWAKVYTDVNTKKDSRTNLLLASSDGIPSTSAASKLVGTAKGQIPILEDVASAALSKHGMILNFTEIDTLNDGAVHFITKSNAETSNPLLPEMAMYFRLETKTGNETGSHVQQEAYNYSNTRRFRRSKNGLSAPWSAWVEDYTTGNTTKDTATGFLKASSPVLHVYNDSITKIHEAEQLDISVDKKGVGHYEIHGTTGLRKDDGWFMSPPRDVHGNVLCMVDLEEKDGVVILRTYKKKFDFETVSIVHDYENPMDIPEGVCVEFRFNDLPMEDTAEPEPVEEPVSDEEVEPVEESVEESE